MYSMQVTILPADSMITPYRVPILTLIGNPNTGKTTPFHALTGRHSNSATTLALPLSTRS